MRTSTILLCLVALQWISRYAAFPGTTLIADDWHNLSQSARYASDIEAIGAGLQDPNRPLSNAAVEAVFRRAGGSTVAYSVIGQIFNSAIIVALGLLIFELTGSQKITWWSGVFYACLPILTETFHWSTQVVNEVACGLLPYVLSGWLWVRHVRRGGPRVLVLSVLFYGIALFSYEAGIFIPAAFAVLCLGGTNRSRGTWLRLVPFALVFVLYVAWRTTNAFGLNHTWYYPSHMKVGISLYWVLYKAFQLLGWWFGGSFWAALKNGLDGFASLSWKVQYLLALLNVGAAAGILITAARLERFALSRPVDVKYGISTWAAAGFGAVWFLAAAAPCLASYLAGRLMVLPAVGASLLAGMILSRFATRRLAVACLICIPLSLSANQGTSADWRTAGAALDRLYKHFQNTRSEWQGREVVFLDTSGLRQRLTDDLSDKDPWNETTWASYRNAPLVRGFVPVGMLEYILKTNRLPMEVVLDAECGGRISGDAVTWHERYNPSAPRSATLDQVFTVDVLRVFHEHADFP